MVDQRERPYSWRRLHQCLVSILLLAQLSDTTLAEDSAGLPPAPDCHYTADFVQRKTLPSLPVPLVSQGSLLFACDLGLIWHTAGPIQETLVYTADSAHFRVDSAGRTHLLQGVAHDFMANLLLGLMAGDSAAVTGHFDVEIVVPETVWLLKPSATVMRDFVTSIGLALIDDALNITVDGARGDKVDIATSTTEPLEGFESGQCNGTIVLPEAACAALRSPSQVAQDVRESNRQ